MTTAAPADGFPQALAFTWRPDFDGQKLHVTPGDPGGATAWGVTLLSYASWRADHGVHVTTAADLGRATQGELGLLIRTRYWNAVQAPALPPGIALLAYEFGFGAGPGTSVRVLQEALDIDADGIIGPQTIDAVRARDPAPFARVLAGWHEDYYRSLSTWRLFGNGWTRRNSDRLELALSIIGAAR